MIKNTEIKLVGQPILKQVLNLVDLLVFKRLVKERSSDYYYKSFKTWPHFVTMMFGIIILSLSNTQVFCRTAKLMV